jgi:hypothetical protein
MASAPFIPCDDTPARALQSHRVMTQIHQPNPESGKVGYAIAWLLGIPLPILLLVYLVSRC